jgi:hypothetical protein
MPKPNFSQLQKTCRFICLASMLFSTSLLADEAQTGSDFLAHLQYKLTLSQYATQEIDASDINLRIKDEQQAFWLAYYHESPTHFGQARVGYERNDTWTWCSLTSSLQLADYGFIGGSLNSQLGGALHVLLGYGRTNLKPYDNINFDPNDAISYGAGYTWPNGNDIALYRVRDNRVIPGQQIDHVLAHYNWHLAQATHKLTLDIFNKNGTADADGNSIAATGVAVADEWSRYFVRVAYDPKVNFSQSDMTRVSVGYYF